MRLQCDKQSTPDLRPHSIYMNILTQEHKKQRTYI